MTNRMAAGLGFGPPQKRDKLDKQIQFITP